MEKKARMPIPSPRRPTFDGKFLRCPKCDVWDFEWCKPCVTQCQCGQYIELTLEDLRNQNGNESDESE